MKCKCRQNRDYEFNVYSADFYCYDCKMTHAMCCVGFASHICGKIDGHDGPHTTINGHNWTNEVYGFR